MEGAEEKEEVGCGESSWPWDAIVIRVFAAPERAGVKRVRESIGKPAGNPRFKLELRINLTPLLAW
jgi:hypothetical protein